MPISDHGQLLDALHDRKSEIIRSCIGGRTARGLTEWAIGEFGESSEVMKECTGEVRTNNNLPSLLLEIQDSYPHIRGDEFAIFAHVMLEAEQAWKSNHARAASEPRPGTQSGRQGKREEKRQPEGVFADPERAGTKFAYYKYVDDLHHFSSTPYGRFIPLLSRPEPNQTSASEWTRFIALDRKRTAYYSRTEDGIDGWFTAQELQAEGRVISQVAPEPTVATTITEPKERPSTRPMTAPDTVGSAAEQICVACTLELELSDFADGDVMRCAWGESAVHGNQPFIHVDCQHAAPGCAKDPLRCPTCGWGGLVNVKSAEQEVPKPEETWGKRLVSRGWRSEKAVPQGPLELGMCYAAAAATAVRSLGGGDDTTPAEFAHRFAMANEKQKLTSDEEPKFYVAQYRKYRKTSSEKWADVYSRMSDAALEGDYGADQALKGLWGTWGTPVTDACDGLDEISGVALDATAPTPEALISAIDSGGLYMSGDNAHWIVAYGYQKSSAGRLKVLYYNPLGGKRIAATWGEKGFQPQACYAAHKS